MSGDPKSCHERLGAVWASAVATGAAFDNHVRLFSGVIRACLMAHQTAGATRAHGIWRLAWRMATRWGVVICTIVLALVGCGVKSGPNLLVKRTSARALAKQSANDLTLVHDFGLVRPNTKHCHRFQIVNTSDSGWTIRRVLVSCVCTVPSVSSKLIEQGSSANIEVEYRAAGKSGQETRSVLVQFNEEEAPTVRLQVRANIRRPMEVSEKRVSWQSVGRGESVERTIYVSNYSGHKWSDLSFQCSVPWLAVEPRLVIDDGNAKDHSIQKWQCRFRANTELLPFGKHEGNIRVVARPIGTDSIEIPVDVTVGSPVAANPDCLFFHSAVCGRPTVATTDLVFRTNLSGEGPKDAELSHDMGDQLALRLLRESHDSWHLEGTLTPSVPGIIRGNINVCFENSNFPELRIPVIARGVKQ